MSERGDLLELVCDAFSQLPTVSATVWSWTHIERSHQATEEARRLRLPGNWPLYPSRPGGEPPADLEQIEHLIVAPHLRAFRIERDSPRPDGLMVVSDGTTIWREVAPGEVLRRPHKDKRLPSSAISLLNPAWLAGYEWDTPTRDTHNGRDVIQIHVRRRAGADMTAAQTMSPVPTADVVIIDAQLGFLHRLAGLAGGQPHHVIELLDVVLDPPIDEQTFRVDESQYRIIDLSEWKRRHRPSGRLSRARSVWHSTTSPFRRNKHPTKG